MKIFERMGAALAAGSLITLLATSVASADTLEISGNGENSINTIAVSSTETCEVKQKANTEVLVDVYTSASTGGNEASGNTGGSVGITTGDATASSTVTVTGGSNMAVNPCCCKQGDCPQAETTSTSSNAALISGNGAGSTNTVAATKLKTSKVKQKANTAVGALVTTKAKTGKNKANGNTGPGAVTIGTGNALSTTDVTVAGGTNTLINP